MNRKLIILLRKEFPEFDAILAFVERNHLPTYACSILSWPSVCGDVRRVGFSDAAISVATVICRAWTDYRESKRAGTGNVEDLTVCRNGPEVSVHTEGHKLIAFTRMSAAEVKYVLATEKYRAKYRYFDQALEFVKQHNLPTGKCHVHARPWEARNTCFWGYSASAEQVAVALCSAWDEYEQELSEVCDNEQLKYFLKVSREGRTVIVRIEDWNLIWFTRLSPAQAKKVKAQWLEDVKARESKRRSSKKTSSTGLAACPDKSDPFKSGSALFSYMPGGDLAAMPGSELFYEPGDDEYGDAE